MQLVNENTISSSKGARVKEFTSIILFIIGLAFLIVFFILLGLFIANVVGNQMLYHNAKTAGLEGVGGYFAASEFNDIALRLGTEAGAGDEAAMYGAFILSANYVSFGDKYWYKTLDYKYSKIDWLNLRLAIIFGVVMLIIFTICIILWKSKSKTKNNKRLDQ